MLLACAFTMFHSIQYLQGRTSPLRHCTPEHVGKCHHGMARRFVQPDRPPPLTSSQGELTLYDPCGATEDGAFRRFHWPPPFPPCQASSKGDTFVTSRRECRHSKARHLPWTLIPSSTLAAPPDIASLGSDLAPLPWTCPTQKIGPK